AAAPPPPKVEPVPPPAKDRTPFEGKLQPRLPATPPEAQRGTVQDWLFLAITHHHLRNRGEARSWLDQALRWGGPEERLPCDQRLEIQQLRREAEDLLRGADR